MRFVAYSLLITSSLLAGFYAGNMMAKLQDTESHAVAITEAYQKGLDTGKVLAYTQVIIHEVPASQYRDTTTADERAATAVINKMCARMTGHKGYHVEPSKELLTCQDTWYREFNYVRNVVLGKEIAK